MTSILVVEDNVLSAATLKRYLREQGRIHVAAIAPSVEIALELLQQHAFDLVHIDVALPVMSGTDLVGDLEQQSAQMLCLILSGHTASGYVGRALAAGAKGYVVKSDPLATVTAVT